MILKNSIEPLVLIFEARLKKKHLIPRDLVYFVFLLENDND